MTDEANLRILDSDGGVDAVATLTSLDDDSDAIDRAVDALQDEFGDDLVQS